jgi:hypothetical protein
VKTLGNLASTKQTQGLFLGYLGEKGEFSRVNCIRFGFYSFETQTAPFPPESLD